MIDAAADPLPLPLPPKAPVICLATMARRTTHNYRKPFSHKFMPIVRSGEVRKLHFFLHSEENWMKERLLTLRDGFGNTALITAASEGNSAMVEYLCLQMDNSKESTKVLSVGVDAVNAQGWNAMHFAAKNNHYGILDLLLQKGGDLYAKTHQGRTALDLALRYKSESCVSNLLLYGVPFPLYIIGRHGAACVEEERNNIVCRRGSAAYEDCKTDFHTLWQTRILPYL